MELDYIFNQYKVTNEQEKIRNLIDMIDEHDESSSFHHHNTQENEILSVNDDNCEASDESKETFLPTVLIRVQPEA